MRKTLKLETKSKRMEKKLAVIKKQQQFLLLHERYESIGREFDTAWPKYMELSRRIRALLAEEEKLENELPAADRALRMEKELAIIEASSAPKV